MTAIAEERGATSPHEKLSNASSLLPPLDTKVSDEQLRRESAGVVAYLDLLGEPERFYAAAVPAVRRKLLEAFFSRIWGDDGGEEPSVLVEERDVVARIRRAGMYEKGAGTEPDAFCVAPSSQDLKVDCSNESNVVAGTGFEPVASGL